MAIKIWVSLENKTEETRSVSYVMLQALAAIVVPFASPIAVAMTVTLHVYFPHSPHLLYSSLHSEWQTLNVRMICMILESFVMLQICAIGGFIETIFVLFFQKCIDRIQWGTRTLA